ncbi:hypothetical protein KSS87_007745 [Heliosperma pusillum]|nr:hypothetical protein KSS87_007745 [Heliosperma pusillum]KAH9619497.1 hypothetical protein KSS87_007745 [Heliosperma pusillum]
MMLFCVWTSLLLSRKSFVLLKTCHLFYHIEGEEIGTLEGNEEEEEKENENENKDERFVLMHSHYLHLTIHKNIYLHNYGVFLYWLLYMVHSTMYSPYFLKTIRTICYYFENLKVVNY